MILQFLSDLHLESQPLPAPQPAAGADALLLLGDIDRDWRGYECFRGWPVPVLAIAGNHEFDGRDIAADLPALRAHLEGCGIRLLERQTCVLATRSGRRVRFLGTTRWSDFDALGAAQRPRAQRAAAFYLGLMQGRLHGEPLDAPRLRSHALACQAWLEMELSRPVPRGADGWDATVVMTHHAPSLRCADPRYGLQPSSASFCNADDALLERADLWLHGHLHLQHDLPRPRGGGARIACNALGLLRKGEATGHRPLGCITV